MNDASSFYVACVTLFLLVSAFSFSFGYRRRYILPLPPGPKPRWFTGNIHQIPLRQSWLTYINWSKEHNSDIIYGKVLQDSFAVINCIKTAVELFEDKSNNYSDRPRIPFVELAGWRFNTAFLEYGEDWRAHRKVFQQAFKKDTAANYEDVQEAEVYQFMQQLLEKPSDYFIRAQFFISSLIMRTIYGRKITSLEDPLVTLVQKIASTIFEATLPGSSPVNVFPIIRHLPSWFPGVGSKKLAEECRKMTRSMLEVPFDLVKQNLENGMAQPSLVSRLLEGDAAKMFDRSSEELEELIRCIAGTVYIGGNDTTLSTLKVMFHALSAHPAVVKKAQRELDSVLCGHRLPTFRDKDDLPYIEAVYREISRWRPITPLGMAHSALEDDVWNGYLIPKGTTIWPNVWAMTREEHVYGDDVESFRPERFLDSSGKPNDNDTPLSFGFGRRLCPGRHFAHATIWLVLSTFLSTFDIGPPKDENGNELELDVEYTEGLVVCPKEFKCLITPRSPGAAKLIYDAFQSRDD